MAKEYYSKEDASEYLKPEFKTKREEKNYINEIAGKIESKLDEIDESIRNGQGVKQFKYKIYTAITLVLSDAGLLGESKALDYLESLSELLEDANKSPRLGNMGDIDDIKKLKNSIKEAENSIRGVPEREDELSKKRVEHEVSRNLADKEERIKRAEELREEFGLGELNTG